MVQESDMDFAQVDEIGASDENFPLDKRYSQITSTLTHSRTELSQKQREINSGIGWQCLSPVSGRIVESFRLLGDLPSALP
jgi:hypothetical protein